ncbi:hypothetical protein JM67_06985 [[Arthrobacter] sp. ATCC 21022]|nr:hypothetical protein JM67_06985 [Arthrobacter sp. ATCC 21022]
MQVALVQLTKRMRAEKTAADPATMMVIPIISQECGNSRLWRIARSWADQRLYAWVASKAPAAARMTQRPERIGAGATLGASWSKATAPAMMASAVRIQARKVLSLASEKR